MAASEGYDSPMRDASLFAAGAAKYPQLIEYKMFTEKEKPPHLGGLDLRSTKLLIINGGQRRDRTAYAGLFRT
jgi:hypothetical protein